MLWRHGCEREGFLKRGSALLTLLDLLPHAGFQKEE
jgi:hypothetical protein